jgi:hypothetical protein
VNHEGRGIVPEIVHERLDVSEFALPPDDPVHAASLRRGSGEK